MLATLKMPDGATGRLTVTGLAEPVACAPGRSVRLPLQLGQPVTLTWEVTSGPVDPPTPVDPEPVDLGA